MMSELCRGRRRALVVLCAWVAVGVVGKAYATGDGGRVVYRDPKAGVEERVADLMGRLTVEEKVNLCYGAFESGGVERLGVGQLKMLDGRQGLRPKGEEKGTRTTLMPCALALSCTWDEAAAERFGRVLGEEMLAVGRHVLLGPNLDLVRSPLGGRNFEDFGEDPFLVGTIGDAYIRGVQGCGVSACASLMAANDYETRRHFTSANMDERTLREVHLLPYEMAMRDGHVWCVMTGNNLINGVHCAQNRHLLQEVVKEGIGYDGPVITDWRAAYDTVPAALAGTDMTTGFCAYVFGDGHLLAAVKSGAVSEKLLDDKVRRVLRLYVRAGVLDGAERGKGSIATPEHRQAARELAAEGMVLLKNEGGVLPLEGGKVRRVLVTGPWADSVLQGEGSGHVPTPGANVSVVEGLKGALGTGVEVKYAAYPAVIRPTREAGSVEWETNAATKPARAGRRRGGAATRPAGKVADIGELVEAARGVDAVVFVAAGWLGGEGRDLPDMELPGRQAEAIAEIAKVNPHVVVVLNCNGAVSLEGFGERVPAIVAMHYAGEEEGDALADVLTGRVNPSGKLSYTFARKLADYPCHAIPGEWPPKLILGKDPVNPGMKPEERKATHAFDSGYAEGVMVGYRWLDEKGIEPWFPFGHGLSYTTFEMGDVKVREREGGGYRVTCKVRNTGERDGAEVVEVYMGKESGGRKLVGFKKVWLKAGEEKEVEVGLRASAVAVYDEQKRGWKVGAGEYEVQVGASSRDIRGRARVVVKEGRYLDWY